jgi:hypothetical protein
LSDRLFVVRHRDGGLCDLAAPGQCGADFAGDGAEGGAEGGKSCEGGRLKMLLNLGLA